MVVILRCDYPILHSTNYGNQRDNWNKARKLAYFNLNYRVGIRLDLYNIYWLS